MGPERYFQHRLLPVKYLKKAPWQLKSLLQLNIANFTSVFLALALILF